MKVTSKSVGETADLAKQIVAGWAPKASGATVVGLYGDLGAGKTTFTQAAAAALDVGEQVTSPTFVLEKIYKLTGQKFTHLIHLDCYRLDSGKELQTLGWPETVADPNNLILVEWPELVSEVVPADHIKIQFKFIDETTREITFDEKSSN